jgi:hypothetical protein
MTLFLTVTFGALISSMPWMSSQLITVLGVVTWRFRVRLPLLATSLSPGHCDRSGPVLVASGQPQVARLAQSFAPPFRQKAGRGSCEVGLGVADATGEEAATLPCAVGDTDFAGGAELEQAVASAAVHIAAASRAAARLPSAGLVTDRRRTAHSGPAPGGRC